MIHPSLTRKVQETAYLTAENADRCRPIMRHCYEQHGMHKYSLTLDEVREHLRAQGEATYSDEQTEQDLRQLVFFQLVSARCERGSIVPSGSGPRSSAIPPLPLPSWTGCCDHSHVINIRNVSYRLWEKKRAGLYASPVLRSDTLRSQGGYLLAPR